MLRLNQEKHDIPDDRKVNEHFPALSTYSYVIDHGQTTTRTTRDDETIAKTTDLNKKKAMESIGLSAASSSSSIQPKKEHFAEKKQLQALALRVKALQFQAMKVSTDLAVKGLKNISLKQHHDELEEMSKTFNAFAITILVAIAEIEGSEGEHSVCLFLGSLLLGEPSRLGGLLGSILLNVHVALHIDFAFTDQGDAKILEKASATAEEAPHHIDAFASCINKMKEVIIEDRTQKAG